MRRIARTDQNQRMIVEALRAAGASVALTHRIGEGFPDLCVSYHDRQTGKAETILVEVKNPGVPLSDQRLTFEEASFHSHWIGRLLVVRTVTEALKAIGATE